MAWRQSVRRVLSPVEYMESKLFTVPQKRSNCMESEFTLEDFLDQCVDPAFQWDPENGELNKNFKIWSSTSSNHWCQIVKTIWNYITYLNHFCILSNLIIYEQLVSYYVLSWTLVNAFNIMGSYFIYPKSIYTVVFSRTYENSASNLNSCFIII